MSEKKSEASSNGNGAGAGHRGWKSTKEGLEDAIKRLSEFSITPKAEVVAPKKEPGTYSLGSEKIGTNMLGVRLSEVTIHVYDVNVIGVTQSDKRLELAKQSRDDYTSLFRKSVCFEAYKVVRATVSFEDSLVYYNGQKVMYSIDKLKLNGERSQTFIIDVDGKKDLGVDIVCIEFTIKEVPTVFTLNDLTSLLQDMRGVDRTLLQFVDIATSQHPLLNPEDYIVYDGGRIYLTKPEEHGFTECDCPNLSDGKFVAVGARKAAVAIEGPKGRGSSNVAVLVDTSKTAFHACQPVLNKAISICPQLLDKELDPLSLTKLRVQFIGLYAEKRQNGSSCVFQITNISPRNASEVTFPFDGKIVTVADYYDKRYSLKLQYSELPLLVSKKSKDRENYFPMELCVIIEKQRVKQRQQTALQLKEMIAACIVAPVKRRENNRLNVAALGLTREDNKLLQNAGLKIIPKPLVANARILPPPIISYGGNNKVKVDINKMWAIGRNSYGSPSTLKMWAAYLIADRRETVGEQDFRTFLQQLLRRARASGMNVDDPSDFDMIIPDKRQVEEVIRLCKQQKFTFVFFVQTDGASLHDAIKCYERQYEIVTQDVRVSNLTSVIQNNKFQTLENIISKINVKLGGLNYGVLPPEPQIEDYLKDGRLIIGFSMTHPDPPTPADLARGSSNVPSVVGYAANTKSENCEFIGDFGYQDARRTDNVALVDTFVKRIVEQYVRNRGFTPEEILIYRSGVSEGQYGVVLDYELPLIRKGLMEGGCDTRVRVTMIVVSRMHNVRLIPETANPKARPAEQNCKPGTVLDQQVVHPRFHEFYLNSHKAMQGTIKVPRYTVIVDDSDYSSDELEMMTYALCYCHQIVQLPTSVPTPLYVATRYAERGRKIMLERCTTQAISASDSTRGPRYAVNLREVNVKLPYYGTHLAEARINA